MFSIILASQTFVIPSTSEQVGQLSETMGSLCGAVIAVVFLAVFAGSFVRRIPGLRNLVLVPPSGEDAGPVLDPALAGEGAARVGEQDPALISKQGVAFSTLRPAGRAQIEGQLIDVVSEGEFIEPGSAIEVVDVSGNKVVVRAIS